MNGIEDQYGDKVDIVRLDLLSRIGRQAAREFNVNMVPVTLLFDGSGKIMFRTTGIPNVNKITERIGRVYVNDTV